MDLRKGQGQTPDRFFVGKKNEAMIKPSGNLT